MTTRKDTLATILTIAIVVLALVVVVAQIVFSVGAGKVSTAESNLAAVEEQLTEAQLENDALQAEASGGIVEWRNAEGRLAYAGDGSGKVCYLTFSGGPTSTLTQSYLDILTENDAVATWFCYADEESVEDLDLSLVSTIEAQGSAVGICGWAQSATYASYWGTIDEYLDEDFRLAEEALEDAAGHEITICRFPGGSSKIAYYNSTLANSLPVEILTTGYQYFDWNISGGDDDSDNYNAKGRTPTDDIVDNVISEAQSYAKTDSPICVMLTDATGKTTTEKALQAVIVGLRELGYTFETLDYDCAGFYQRDVYDESEEEEEEDSSEDTSEEAEEE